MSLPPLQHQYFYKQRLNQTHIPLHSATFIPTFSKAVIQQNLLKNAREINAQFPLHMLCNKMFKAELSIFTTNMWWNYVQVEKFLVTWQYTNISLWATFDYEVQHMEAYLQFLIISNQKKSECCILLTNLKMKNNNIWTTADRLKPLNYGEN